ncbi:DUF4440 domain-containing protein [Agrobacterium larrymoorei]|uniref:DUF4440 domain-containing protein n=1 Tax=Agrobacterium larrymoorei TaxID=160699 RepID=A0A4D7DPI4_9HYPH|nr:DUF4440 domain-containing protein [Agrobacterium larrymoorei]QCI97504.1 DUF4440 domain-containing protein [Agrobacterium larrymoorei]QYA07057.1 DUF4440 domain-containing protein [Agrobacterium larrymoorei]
MHEEDMPLSDADFNDIRRLEESLWITETRYDTKLMNEVFAKDFFEFGRSGRTYARADLIIEARPGQIIDATIPLLNFHARHLSADIVQVTYISEAVYGGEVERANRSSIWSRGIDGWRLRFHQGTPVYDVADTTVHLLSNDANAKRLHSSVQQLRGDEFTGCDPIKPS